MIILIQIYLLLLSHHYNNVLPYKQSIIFNKNQIDYIRKRNHFLLQSLIMKYLQIDFYFNQQLVIHQHLFLLIHVIKILISLTIIHHLSPLLMIVMMIHFQVLVVFVHVLIVLMIFRKIILVNYHHHYQKVVSKKFLLIII